MKKKIIGIFVCILLFASTIPATGNTDAKDYNKDEGILVKPSVSPLYDKETYMVEMRDGINLATDVYLPDEGIYPHGSILIRTVYNKNNINQFLNGQDYYLEDWVDEYKWPFVVQDERGFYASEGESTNWPGGDYFDGYDTVEWVASQDWSNGKIATWGRSAFGMNQYFMAGSNPPALSCQYIGVATSDMHKDFCFHGGQARIYLLDYYLNEEDLSEIFENENFTFDYWGNVSLEDKWDNVNVPAIHIGGWYDPYMQGTIDAFMGYHYNGGVGAKGKSKLVMGPWTHLQFGYNESETGELTFPDNQYDTFSRYMFSDMINQYTMDGDDFDKWPTVTYYVMGDVDEPDAPGNKWRYADDWPISTDETCYYFHEGELLSNDNPESYSPITYSYDPTNPVPTKGGQNLAILFDGPMDQRSVEDRDDVLIFSTPVLTEPVETTGPVKARLFVSSNCVDTDFTVKLTDVYPDGRSMIIADGILRMRNRNGRDHWELMNPGEIYEVEVDLWSTSYIWNEGHKIRVAVSSSNFPRFLPNPNTADAMGKNTTYNVAQNILYLDSDHPSCIILQTPNNYAPDTPSINGEINGKKGKEYEYTLNSLDPDSDEVKYFIDWGDNNDDWTEFFSSGTDVKVKHTWSDKGQYTIKARAKDTNGLWSEWTKLEVTMPKNKPFINNFPLLNWLFERFPKAFPLIRYFL